MSRSTLPSRSKSATLRETSRKPGSPSDSASNLLRLDEKRYKAVAAEVVVKKMATVKRTAADMYPLIEQYLNRPQSMTRSSFCEQHGLSFASFRYWYRRYTRNETETAEEHVQEDTSFVELKPRIGPESPGADALVEVVLPGGTRLRLLQHVAPQYVERLIAILARQS